MSSGTTIRTGVRRGNFACRRLTACLLGLVLGAVAGVARAQLPAGFQVVTDPLTNIQQLLKLRPETARDQSIPARLRGVVTYANSRRQHFFLHDGTGGAMIVVRSPVLCRDFGEEVEVIGTSVLYNNQPALVAQFVESRGAGRLPAPIRARAAAVAAIQHYSQWVQVEGTVIQWRNGVAGGQVIQLLDDSGVVSVAVAENLAEPPEALWGARLRVTGVNVGPATSALLARQRQLCEVLSPGTTDPFSGTLTSLAELAGSDAAPARRVKVRGVVLDTGREAVTFLRDGAAACQVIMAPNPVGTDREFLPGRGTVPLPVLRRGDVVELMAVPQQVRPYVRLQYALARVLRAGEEPEPVPASLDQVFGGRTPNELVSVRGRLVSYECRPGNARWTEILKLEDNNTRLDVVLESTRSNQLAALPIDDLVEASGIARPEPGTPPYRVRVWSTAGVRALGPAPELVRKRRWRTAGIIAGASALPAICIVLLLNRLARERQLARERSRADAAVRELNSELESRVAQRTAELESTKEELRHALAAERELGELKSRFVSLVSHEFRTPLGITMSAVELLRNYLDRLPPAKLRELLDDIYNSTLRMSGLMEQVLVLGRVEAGRVGCQRASIDLPALAGRLVEETQATTQQRCPIELVLRDDLSGALADESLLRHIFSNLLSNAVKYSPAGSPVVFAVYREGDDAVWEVRDRGIGIPAADQPRLFEAFHRAANVGDISGTGLGLLIVRRCVELHGGTIRVVSSPGEGTTFTVRLPVFADLPVSPESAAAA